MNFQSQETLRTRANVKKASAAVVAEIYFKTLTSTYGNGCAPT